LIRVAGVSKTFAPRSGPSVPALAAIDLEVPENAFVTLVGRSGCGKSTLLRIVAGLVPPSAGTVTVDGSEVRGPSRDVALVFQRPALLPWRDVLDNVLLPAEIHGLDRRRARAEAEELLALAGLAGFERQRPWELSGGMQQRVALCRALLTHPRVLLMDEPFAALDALTREELSLELQRIWSERRTTILFVTHSIAEAAILSDRVIVLTPRPGSVGRVVDVPVPRPRAFGAEARDAELAAAEAAIREALAAQREELAA
jgi:NitT/TauT family transport system ATP-binding protein